MRRLDIDRAELPGPLPGPAALLRLRGFINPATNAVLDRAFEEVVGDGVAFVVLDMERIDYINSLAISSFVHYTDQLAEKGGALVLTHVSPDVRSAIEVLGLGPVLRMEESTKGAIAFLRQLPPPQPGLPRERKKKTRFDVPKGVRAHEGQAVLAVVQGDPEWLGLLRSRLEATGASLHVINDAEAAPEPFVRANPDVIVLEDAVEGSARFLLWVKAQKDKSLVSVVRVLADAKDNEQGTRFKIWEDGYVVEPVDADELWALVDAELVRVPKDRQKYHHILHMTFDTSDENYGLALSLAKNVIDQAGFRDDMAVSMFMVFQEAVDNAYRHAHAKDDRKQVDVVFQVDTYRLIITVEDQGRGFDSDKYLEWARTEKAADRLRLGREGRLTGGLGIRMLVQRCDEIVYSETGKKVRLVKRIAPPKERVIVRAPGIEGMPG